VAVVVAAICLVVLPVLLALRATSCPVNLPLLHVKTIVQLNMALHRLLILASLALETFKPLIFLLILQYVPWSPDLILPNGFS
jgi:hypothetical protein